MITGFASLTGRLLLAFAFVFTVTACGGGGGGGGSFVPPQDEGEILFLAVTLLDENGNATDTISSSVPTTARVRVTRNGPNGRAITDLIVTLQTDIGTIFPASGSALTDNNGVAQFRIEVDPSTRGAGTLLAGADNDTGSFTGSLNFQIGNSDIRLGFIDEDGLFIENEIRVLPNTTIASPGVAELSMVILDEDGIIGTEAQTVLIDSGCISTSQAILDPVSPVLTGDGRVNVTYTPTGCIGNDQITASIVGSNAQAFGTVSIAQATPDASGFVFVGAEPTTLVLKGTGGTPERTEFSTVTFRVIDNGNNPEEGVEVNFSLSTSTGGITLSNDSAISDAEGLVSTNISSGDVPTVVRVIATAEAGDGSGEEVSTVSDLLTITTGLPDQNSISVVVSTEGGGFVIENGMVTDGVTRTITVSMSDKFNNPVSDGTSAVFTTEYGSIESSCETVGGTCSVIWRSQQPRFPTLTGTEFIQTIEAGPTYNCPETNSNNGPCPSDLGFTRGGRSTILVTAIGEESFIDRNGNGIMDEDERLLFDNLSDAFLDNNEDNIFNPATAFCQGAGADTPECIAGQEEIFFDFASTGRFNLNNNPPLYNGLLCPPEGDGVWCERELINVRDDVVVILSDPTFFVDLYFGRNRINNSGTAFDGGPYTLYISDIFNNRPPANSTISLSTEGDCEVLGESSFTVRNTNDIGALTINGIRTGGVRSETSTTPPRLVVTLTPTDGVSDSESFPCEPAPPPDPNEPNGGDGDPVVGP